MKACEGRPQHEFKGSIDTLFCTEDVARLRSVLAWDQHQEKGLHILKLQLVEITI